MAIPFKGFQNMGSDLWMDILKQTLAIQKGELGPWETPQFKAMMPFLNQQWEKSNKNLYQQAVDKGITGGSLGQVMAQTGEGQNSAILQLINQMYGQSMNQGSEAWKNYLSWRNPRIAGMMQGSQGGGGKSFNWASLLPIAGAAIGSLIPGGTALGGMLGGLLGGVGKVGLDAGSQGPGVPMYT